MLLRRVAIGEFSELELSPTESTGGFAFGFAVVVKDEGAAAALVVTFFLDSAFCLDWTLGSLAVPNSLRESRPSEVSRIVLLSKGSRLDLAPFCRFTRDFFFLTACRFSSSSPFITGGMSLAFVDFLRVFFLVFLVSLLM